MYAVIEFERKECAIVPLHWLVDNQSKCLWPNRIKGATLEKMVESMEPPKQSWTKYKVVKLLNISEDHQSASTYLTRLLEENASSTSDNLAPEVQLLTLKTMTVDGAESSTDEDEGTRETPSVKKQKLSRSHNKSAADDISSEDFSSDELGTPTNLAREQEPPNKRNPSSLSMLSKAAASPASYFSEAGSSSVQSNTNSEEPSNLLELLLRQVEHIRAVQDQQTIKLDNIERNQQTSAIQQLQRPSTMPNLPISNKSEYKVMEDFLVDENNALYLRRRLAAIGGSSVRNTVMNILKFLMTNKVAMKFNWSGREKRAFKETRMVTVITEAVKLSYSGREPSDLTDTDINTAIKDWLKLAKHRYMYSREKIR